MSKLKVTPILRFTTLTCSEVEQMNSTTQIQKKHHQTLTNLESICTLSVSQEKSLGSQKFVDVVQNAVDLVFSELGDSCRQIVNSYLLDKFGLNMQSIPHNLDLFVYALESIFGQASSLIEMQIMREIHEEVKDFKHYPYGNELSFLSFLLSLRDFL